MSAAPGPDPRAVVQALYADPSTAEALVPRAEDLAAVFEDGAAWAQAYDAAFEDTPRPGPVAGPHRIHHVIGGLDDDDLAGLWPQGLLGLADRVQDGVVWCLWRVVPEGQRRGTAYAALAWTGTRWVWLPKPWRWAPERAATR